ncbi:hypothetical protein B0T10DRAFT_130479 [Thelonectria olida]|uniref:Uncharacterized protein n=1 Tax=Thelonectria olida TaxID=1576542 RepID=A0A9P8VYY1_9HYPO|nr:hypothetical protein B0T10DRAFT_130479 [Thelonectria olida]
MLSITHTLSLSALSLSLSRGLFLFHSETHGPSQNHPLLGSPPSKSSHRDFSSVTNPTRRPSRTPASNGKSIGWIRGVDDTFPPLLSRSATHLTLVATALNFSGGPSTKMDCKSET